KDLDKQLKAVIFGQDQAITKVVASIKMSRTGLGRDHKPIGSYLFAGPTGVGKTEVAKQLAEIMGISFQRFDMSEYMEKHAVSRLVGAPPGYVGYEEGGLLTDAITKNFRPEFVNRLDAIVEFQPLDKPLLLQVIRKFVSELEAQLLKKTISMEVYPDAIEWLYDKGYDPAYGARPFARVIDEHIKRRLVDDI